MLPQEKLACISGGEVLLSAGSVDGEHIRVGLYRRTKTPLYLETIGMIRVRLSDFDQLVARLAYIRDGGRDE